MPKIILGIDPGIADTGYGIIKDEGGKLTCLKYGSIKTQSGLDLSLRLKLLYEELGEIIDEYVPEEAAVEKIFFNKNVKTALIVGQARGVVLLLLKQKNLPLSEYTPGQIKQSVASYGKADKRQVQKMVKLILGLKTLPQPDDAADALAAAICGLNSKIL